MQAALDMAEENTRKSGATQIHRIRIRVGSLSGVVPEALRFAFDGLKNGTPAERAELELEPVPAVAWCPGCAAEFEVADLLYECPRCHRSSGELRHGLELDLAAMEVS